jgi:hypothetical protein
MMLDILYHRLGGAMPEQVYKAEDVYGVGRELPLNYVTPRRSKNMSSWLMITAARFTIR